MRHQSGTLHKGDGVGCRVGVVEQEHPRETGGSEKRHRYQERTRPGAPLRSFGVDDGKRVIEHLHHLRRFEEIGVGIGFGRHHAQDTLPFRGRKRVVQEGREGLVVESRSGHSDLPILELTDTPRGSPS